MSHRSTPWSARGPGRGSALLVPLAAALSALALTATEASAAAPGAAVARCQEKSLKLRAAPTGQRYMVLFSVTNRGRGACTVDRAPVVTFGALDGSAQPVPPVVRGRYRLPRGGTAYAAVRTIDPAGTTGRVVDSMTVSGDPSHWGTAFRPAQVGMGRGIRVWEPLTTRWQPSGTAARTVLNNALR